VVTLCRNCHISIEREAKKLNTTTKYEAFQIVKTRLTSPKFVTIFEMDVEPSQALEVLVKLGLVETTPNKITPTTLGIQSGIIKPTEGGFLIRKEPLKHD